MEQYSENHDLNPYVMTQSQLNQFNQISYGPTYEQFIENTTKNIQIHNEKLIAMLSTISGITTVLAALASATLIAAKYSASFAITLSATNPLFIAAIGIISSVLLGKLIGNSMFNFFKKSEIIKVIAAAQSIPSNE